MRTQIGDLERLVVDLHKSEAQFRVIAENAADLISIVDARGAFTYYSPSYEKVLGFAPAALARKSVAAHIHPEDQFKVILIAEYAFETGVGQFLEYRMRHLDGSWRAFEAHADPVRNAHGQIEHLVLVARDITQLRRVEAQLHHVQKMESIGQLAAGIAHEINTPTQYIGDNTRFLQEAFADIHRLLGDYDRLYHAAAAGTVPPELLIAVESSVATADVGYLSEEIPKAIEQSLQGVQRVSKIVGSMKEFSHPGTDEKVAIDLNQSIESTLTVATNEWRYVANMVTDFDRTLPQVHCLPGEFNQVVLNIVVNACHAIADVPGDGSGGKGTITVSTRRRGDWVEVRICDTGAGIPEDIRHKIFDPFFTTKGVGKGTGQGLAIAHAVMVNKHGGVIEVESEVGKGTTFIIRMPINPATEKKAA